MADFPFEVTEIDDGLIDEIFNNHQKNRRFNDNELPIQNPDLLLQAYADFHNEAEKHITPGMLVQWKPKMRSRTFPSYGEPCVVMRMLERREALVETDSGFQAAIDRIDMEIGFFDSDGDFFLVAVDKRRFMPWEPLS
jgi:hypothetical protein